MKQWIYKWLPIIFGCHCRSERSFHWKGRQFPICARCTGELVGIVLCLITFSMISCSSWIFAVLMLPMILDGGVQLVTSYESTNSRRFITGMLFGYALMRLFMVSTIWAFRFGYNLK